MPTIYLSVSNNETGIPEFSASQADSDLFGFKNADRYGVYIRK
jgi:hypothetical protein